MNGRVRAGLSIVAVVFTGYLVVGGLVWTAPVTFPAVFLAAIGLYLATTWLCIFWGPTRRGVEADDVLHRGPALPVWLCVLALATAVIVPSSTWYAVDVGAHLEPFATWSVGGIGALMAIVVVRRRVSVAWIGVAALAVAAVAWIGVVDALTFGVVGSIVWVVAAQLLTALVDRAGNDTAELTAIQRRSSEWLASQGGRRRERRVRVRHALSVAGPVLIRTIETGGRLSDEEREQARLAEGALRDELRGPRLLDSSVRARLHEARSRGSVVTVLDEGGLEGVGEATLERIRRDLARVLEGADSDRIYIRTSPHDRIAVTIVGRSRAESDEDEVVDLWHEISHTDDDAS
jgi:hypothetical protein